MKQAILIISEKFYSIQGEGVTAGIPSIFIRLAGCNILCKSASWVCDTIEVWKKGTPFNFEDVLKVGEVESLKNGTHLIFTGGEPMLHQEKIFAYMTWFNTTHGFWPFIEVETNGTIDPSVEMVNIVDQWNVSPKLTNSGVSEEARINPKALARFDAMDHAMFKFVIAKDEDAREVAETFLPLNRKRIVLMPAGATQDELAVTRPLVAELCKAYGYRYSDRLHVVIWNLKTGV